MSKKINMNPYLTSGYGKLYLHFYLSKDALMSKVEIDLEDPLYDIKEYLKGMYESWNEEGNISLKELANEVGSDIPVKWGTAGASFYISMRLIEAVMNPNRRKRNFYRPFSKKVVYNNVDEVALRNMAYLEDLARKHHTLEPFNLWFIEYKISRRGTGTRNSKRVSYDKAFKIFCERVEQKN